MHDTREEKTRLSSELSNDIISILNKRLDKFTASGYDYTRAMEIIIDSMINVVGNTCTSAAKHHHEVMIIFVKGLDNWSRMYTAKNGEPLTNEPRHPWTSEH